MKVTFNLSESSREALVELLDSSGWQEYIKLLKAANAARRRSLLTSVTLSTEERAEHIGRLMGLYDSLRGVYTELDKEVPAHLTAFFLGDSNE